MYDMKNSSIWIYRSALLVIVAICYRNSYKCGFVFDDVSAIVDNKDLRPHTPMKNLFFNDFWGTPMEKERSHKSYRPLSVLTFRINYAFGKLSPDGYHITNVILHFFVCLLLLRVYSLFVPELCSFLASCLFAIHPIHTEAVTGVVGRAESLSAIFFLLSFLSYTKGSNKQSETNWIYLSLSIIMVIMATLCKEQGITVIAVCCSYEIFFAQKISLKDLCRHVTNCARLRKWPPPNLVNSIRRSMILVISTLLLLLARIKVMGTQLPVFSSFDNPASTMSSPFRQMTYNYLMAVNSWLLLFPSSLCCDWTMGTIPVIRSILDPRNIATVAFYMCIVMVIKLIWSYSTPRSRILVMSLSFLVFPFVPASNLFFPVGFVVAERILYTPSIGFCLLVAYGFTLLTDWIKSMKALLYLLFLLLVIIHTGKTIRRNSDWESEYSLFQSALKVNRNNAKLWNNVGHALEKYDDYDRALKYFQKAASVQSDDIGAHTNVGRTFTNLKRYTEAEEAYGKAIALLPPVRPGQRYTARIAQNHLNVFLNLANLISKNHSRLLEADALYKKAVSMRPDYIQGYINRGDILIKLGRHSEAVEQYKLALVYEPDNSDAYFNLGVLSLQEGKQKEALDYFNSAIEHNPDHHASLFNSAVLMQEMGMPELRPEAYHRLEKLHTLTPRDAKVYFNQAMLRMDDQRFEDAEALLKEAIAVDGNFSSALFNMALMLNNNMNRSLDAYVYLEHLLQHYPNHTKGLTLMGDININVRRDLITAEQNYLRILEINSDDVQARHNLCVVYVESGDILRGERCLTAVLQLAPHESYIARHLDIVRKRIQSIRDERARKTATSSGP